MPGGVISLPGGPHPYYPGGTNPYKKKTTQSTRNPKMTSQMQKAAKNGVSTGSVVSAVTKGDQKVDPNTGETTPRVERVKHIQTVLRNHGYDVKVDGIAGPKTNSALADFHGSHPNSTKWSRANGSSAAPVADLATRQKQSDGPTNAKANANAAASGSSSSAGGTDPNAGMAKLLSSITGKSGGINPAKWEINPAKVGAAQAGSEYDPQISQANQNISDAGKQAKINLADLSKWFGDAGSIAKTSATQSKQDFATAQKDNTAASQAILSAFGGDAGAGGASLANTAQNGANTLAAEGANTSSFNDMLKGLISSQGADAQTQQNSKDQASIADMKNALTSLVAAKAKALTTDTASARQQNLTNLLGITQANTQSEAAKLNQLATLAMLPSQIQGAGLKGLSTQSLIDERTAATQKASTPKSFFVNATAGDILAAKQAIQQAVKGKNYTPQQAATLAKNLIPWKANTPGVASRVILPGLTLAGVSGVTPAMLGITQ